MYFIYLVKCSDNTLYCGIAKDLPKRLSEHNGAAKGGAKYTKSRRPVELVYKEEAKNLSEALKREIAIKKLTRKEKEDLFAFVIRS
jgi:putative endonuclease